MMQACADFSKPAGEDEERLLQSVIGLSVQLTKSEQERLRAMQNEYQAQIRAEKALQRAGRPDAYDDGGGGGKLDVGDSVLRERLATQDKVLVSQQKQLAALTEQNQILLEAARHYQQKATLAMAAHRLQNTSPGNGKPPIASRPRPSPGGTPGSAPLTGSTGTSSPGGAFRQLRISTPPVSAMSSGGVGERALLSAATAVPSSRGPSGGRQSGGGVGGGVDSAGGAAIGGGQTRGNSTVLSQLMTSNAGKQKELQNETSDLKTSSKSLSRRV